ncbi:MAG: NUDIX hydrolase [Planctomycetota bacterium]|nr:NUDIX hydrolase [Planctomycetota bacterium]
MSALEEVRYCLACGGPTVLRQPDGDGRDRQVCTQCDRVHYENPRIVTGCIIETEGGLLLCKRSIEPQDGLWTIPAGFLELDEDIETGARRETWEEALAKVHIFGLHSILDLPHVGQCYILFRAKLEGDAYGPGEESREVKIFPKDSLPWNDLAFPVVHTSLQLFLEDEEQGVRCLHRGAMLWSGEGGAYDHSQFRLTAHRRESFASVDEQVLPPSEGSA